MRLLFAVSDHGFGHATRTIALLRCALRIAPRLSVRLLSGPGTASLLRGSFAAEPRIEVVDVPSDPGLVLHRGTLRVDSVATARAWARWVREWDGWLVRRQAEDGPADAVVADGTPPALLLARRMGVPGILLGNFSWTDVLSAHLPPDLFQRVADAQSGASAALCYPFHLPFSGAPSPSPLPLVARRAGRSRAEMRRRLGVGRDEPLIYMSAGQSSNPESLWRVCRSLGARPLLPHQAPAVDGAVRIPPGETEGQDYLAASDLVLGKVGYGTLSEALSAGVPLVMVLVAGTAETGPLEEGMRRADAGEAIGAEEDPLPAVARWLGRGASGRGPFLREDSLGAAARFLEQVEAARATWTSRR